MSEGLQELLAWTGVLLFAIGLVGGFAIPVLKSPRIGLSAHTAAIQSGLALIALAWVGGRLTLSDGWAAAIAHTAWLSLYVLWLGLMVGAYFGTGRTLPIAGAGHVGEPWQERLALLLIGASSVGSAAAFVMLLIQWSWRVS